MLIWFIFALLVLVPLTIHLRGGGIVALASSVMILYPLAVLAAWLVLGADTPDLATVTAPEVSGPYGDTYMVVANFAALGWVLGLFALIAIVFWALNHWNASLPHDRLKTLFWLLHISILALPFAMFVFLTVGLLESFTGSPNDLPVFAMSSAIVSIVCLIAIGGFIVTALGAAFRLLRP